MVRSVRIGVCPQFTPQEFFSDFKRLEHSTRRYQIGLCLVSGQMTTIYIDQALTYQKMLTNSNIVIRNKNHSEKLRQMMNNLVGLSIIHKNTQMKAKELRDKINKQAEIEDLDDEALRNLFFEEFRKKGVSDRTIRRWLPKRCKNANMVRTPKERIIQINNPPGNLKPGEIIQLHQDIMSPLGDVIVDWKQIHLRSIDVLELRNWCNQQLGIKRKTVRGYIDDGLFNST